MSDCKSGLVCQKRVCKKGSGEDCEGNDECAGRMLCSKGVCKKKKRRQLKVNKHGNIEDNTIESSLSIKEIKAEKVNEGVIGVNGEDNRKQMYEEKWNPSKKMSDKNNENTETRILDVCNYSSYVVYLMNDKTLILSEKDDERVVSSKLEVKMLVNFNGYLYAIANNKLYYLDNNTLDTKVWDWKKVSWSPDYIVDMSVPHDKSCIWIRTRDSGILYDENGKVIEEVDAPYRRVYGVDRDNYLIFDNNGDAVMNPGNNPIPKVKDGIINHKREIFTLDKKDKRFRMMRLVNWKPYYIP